MTAFGPFSGTETIDFERLGHNPLFLINGPTGSGKTTILDAICFALYAKSTGDEREATQMRCDFSEPGILTEVTFIFKLAEKTYRIRRLPEQQRPQIGREGFTNQKPHAELVEIREGGEERLIVAEKVMEATREIEEMTGLNADQFRQVMVLPQGKFRQLLMAESKDREKIFSKLFQTQIYQKLEESLKSQAGEIRRERDEQTHKNKGILEAVELETAEELSEELEALSPKCEEARLKKQAGDKTFLAAVNQLQAARNLSSQFLELEKTRQQHNELLARLPEINQKRHEMSRVELALTLLPLQREVNRCRSELTAATEKLDQTEKDKRLTRENLSVAEEKLKSVDSLTVKLDQEKQTLAKLDGYLQRSADFLKVTQELAAAEKDEKEAGSLLSKADENQNQLAKALEQSEKELTDLQQAQTVFADKKLELKELSDHLPAREELVNRQQKLVLEQEQLTQTEQTGKRLANAHDESEKLVIALEMSWHLGQASLLAKDLKTGTPCPVCGSLDHPVLAQTGDIVPSEQELEQARKDRNQLGTQLAKAREDYAEVRSRTASLQKEINQATEKMGPLFGTSTDVLKDRIKMVEADVHRLQKEQGKINGITGIIVNQKIELTSVREAFGEVQRQANVKKSVLAGVRAKLESARQELPEVYRQAGALEQKQKETQQGIEEQEQKIKAIRHTHQELAGQWKAAEASSLAAAESRKTAVKALQNTTARWESALKESVFETEITFQVSLQQAEQLENSQKELDEYDSQVSSVKGALEQQALVLKDQKKPDLASLEAFLQQVETEKAATDKIWQVMDNRLNLLLDTRKKLKKAAAESEKLDQRYALVGTLSDVANGLTGNKVSLQRFVLSVLLDDVLVEASHRLKSMSKGRYQLLRKEDRSKGNKASGLDLEVEDAYTGKVRSVATLSGGESFMAALAMALGLSDVVQAYAGGIKLDTLFVDEGFGSLDPESLELAIRTLIDLQSSGRMIGIISHVSELKEQLSTRLDIVADHKGSSIRLVTPEG